MWVTNLLEAESFAYTNEKEDLGARRDEIGELMEIVAYCRDPSVEEPLLYQEKLWDVYVQDGVTFADWLYGQEGIGSEDDRRRMMEAMSKKELIPYVETTDKNIIHIALGEFPYCISKVQEYIIERRNILASVRDVKEYEAFMSSCFINSCFADNILSEMKYIQDFPNKAREITDALGILNDKAIELYQKYSNNLKEAMNILSVLLQRECAPDPKHTKDLVFSFTYSEQLEERAVAKTKNIECSPHLKLIHSGSNLRIYFYWCDKNVGAGEKVLVGRIGRHPY